MPNNHILFLATLAESSDNENTINAVFKYTVGKENGFEMLCKGDKNGIHGLYNISVSKSTFALNAYPTPTEKAKQNYIFLDNRLKEITGNVIQPFINAPSYYAYNIESRQQWMSFLTQNNGTLGEPGFEEHIYSDALEDDLTSCRSIIKTGDNEGFEYKLAKLENPTLYCK